MDNHLPELESAIRSAKLRVEAAHKTGCWEAEAAAIEELNRLIDLRSHELEESRRQQSAGK